MRRALLFLSLLCVGCGSRTAPRVGDGGAGGACTDPPWILFDYLSYPTADVYAMRPDGSELRRVALPTERVLDPGVSADGRTLVYVDVTSPDADALVVYDLATHTARSIFSATDLSYPTFSPEGSLISFADGLDLHVVHRDGTGDRALITGPYEIGCCGWGYGHPVFENASTIVWTTAGLIGTIQTDGSGMRTLLMSDFTILPYPNPTLSPDGTRLATLTPCSGSDTALRIYPFGALPAGCTSAPIVVDGLLPDSGATNSPNPAWGPTDLIAFGQGNDVFVVSAHGGTPQNLTATLTAAGGAAGNPVWAPGCLALP